MAGSAEVRRNIVAGRVISVRPGEVVQRIDRFAGEEPMEIRAGGPGVAPAEVAVTMRTPGYDFELAVGFLFTEGLIAPGDVGRVSYCEDLDEEQAYNVVTVRTVRPIEIDLDARRFHATSSCGICGKSSLDQVEVMCAPIVDDLRVEPAMIGSLPEVLRTEQSIFDRTGGLHAAGLFDADGNLLTLREDVGRHNAVDKLVGRALLSGDLPLSRKIVVVSGRIGFEIVQKVAVAGAPVLCAVGAPSSLAVDAGERLGVTLVGFVRPDSFNCYTHPERLGLN